MDFLSAFCTFLFVFLFHLLHGLQRGVGGLVWSKPNANVFVGHVFANTFTIKRWMCVSVGFIDCPCKREHCEFVMKTPFVMRCCIARSVIVLIHAHGDHRMWKEREWCRTMKIYGKMINAHHLANWINFENVQTARARLPACERCERGRNIAWWFALSADVRDGKPKHIYIYYCYWIHTYSMSSCNKCALRM